MEFDLKNNVLTVFLNGRIDSANASQVEIDIDEIRENNSHDTIIFDAQNLDYISSAGLRVVLRTRKCEPKLEIINVSSDVYDVFEMTGFTEMIKIEKAYRRLSVDGCEVIGQGANGMVYRLDADTVIKVYFNPDSLPDIRRERELARKAFVLGVPTAIPYDVVRVGDGYGSVFELLNANSFAQLIATNPQDTEMYIKLYVELLKKIHATEVKPGDMPDMKNVALGWAEFLKEHLPDTQFNKLYSLIDTVPADNHMIHGDYHIKNVMMQNGEVLLIDMDTLCVGNPVFEFASIFLAYIGFGEYDNSNTLRFLGVSHEVAVNIWKRTLELYFNTTDEKKLQVFADKAMVVGYTRLLRRTIRRMGYDDPVGSKIIDICKGHLSELLDKVDTLAF